jgi:hypothetical protein
VIDRPSLKLGRYGVVNQGKRQALLALESIMLNIILERSDRIESVLPAIEKAMASGEVCRLQNVACLGSFERVSQALVAMVEELLEGTRQCHARPGFQLQGIDNRGVTRTLLL